MHGSIPWSNKVRNQKSEVRGQNWTLPLREQVQHQRVVVRRARGVRMANDLAVDDAIGVGGGDEGVVEADLRVAGGNRETGIVGVLQAETLRVSPVENRL